MWPMMLVKLLLHWVIWTADVRAYSECEHDGCDPEDVLSNDILLLQLQHQAAVNFTWLEGQGQKLQHETASSSCTSAGKVEHCDKIDVASCANSCCVVQFSLQAGDGDLHGLLLQFLSSGGEGNGEYRLVADAAPFDTSSRSITANFKNALQIQHKSGDAFTETITMNMFSASDMFKITAMSISDQHGTISDHGQNYKNLVFMFSRAFGIDARLLVIKYGCGNGPELIWENLNLVQTNSSNWAPYEVPKSAGRQLKPLSAIQTAGGAESSSFCKLPTDLYCNHADAASCGSSCCLLDVYTTLKSADLYNEVITYLKSGGLDKSYGYVAAGSPPDKLSLSPANNVSYNYVYAFQGMHADADGTHPDYATINFGIREYDGFAILRAHLHYNDPLVLYDIGQSFKSLQYMLSALGYWKRWDTVVVHGCTNDEVVYPLRQSLELPLWLYVLAITVVILALYCQDRTQQEKAMLGRETSVLLVPD